MHPGRDLTTKSLRFVDIRSRPTMREKIPRIESMQKWVFLIVAIVSEVAGTSALKSAEGFTRLWPSTIVVLGYASAFYFLSLTLKAIPVGIAYAIWSGVGTALIVLVAWIFMGQKLDLPAMAGILLIFLGVLVLYVFSKSIAH